MFDEFPKIARLSRECVITEKIDGTNAQVYIYELPDDEVMPTHTPIIACYGRLLVYAGSRNRFITPSEDNHGFAAWVRDHADELIALGPGRHFGEWWGSGIQRGYGLQKGEKRFSLFNVARWADPVDRDTEKFPQDRPACCGVVPLISRAVFSSELVDQALKFLAAGGSLAAPGFMKPEGIVIWHEAARLMFKKTLERDEEPKSKSAAA